MFRSGEMYAKRGEMKQAPWIGRMEPFRVVGNVCFVGTYQASCHLIDTGEGLIMIDPGYSDTAHLVMDSIHRLGLDPMDIRYIVNTHWHGDHTAATAAFAGMTGAKTLLGREDAQKAAKFFTPDILIDDGDTLTLGNTTMRFLHTPGHTKGTISFFFDTREGDRVYRVGSFGGAGLNTLAEGHFDFEGCREAYFASLERLKGEQVDVFIGNHTWNNDTYGKGQRLLAGGENEFVDGTLWLQFLESYKNGLQKLIDKEASKIS